YIYTIHAFPRFILEMLEIAFEKFDIFNLNICQVHLCHFWNFYLYCLTYQSNQSIEQIPNNKLLLLLLLCSLLTNELFTLQCRICFLSTSSCLISFYLSLATVISKTSSLIYISNTYIQSFTKVVVH